MSDIRLPFSKYRQEFSSVQHGVARIFVKSDCRRPHAHALAPQAKRLLCRPEEIDKNEGSLQFSRPFRQPKQGTLSNYGKTAEI